MIKNDEKMMIKNNDKKWWQKMMIKNDDKKIMIKIENIKDI